MFKINQMEQRLGITEQDKIVMSNMDTRVSEAQAIHLRKSAAIAILSELAHFYKDRGDDRMKVLRIIEEQSTKTMDSLVLPKLMYKDIVQKAMLSAYAETDRRARLVATMIEGIREINKEDQGGDDAGMGLPADLKATVQKLEKWDKVIDETADLVVEAGGNKFIQTSLASMATHLPRDFVTMISK